MSDPEVRRRWGLAVSRRDLTQEIDEELQFHLEMRVESLIAQGLSPEEARSEALRRFGGVQQVQAECSALQMGRERSRMRHERLADFARDLRLGWRGLRRNPVFALTAVLTLGLGIGVTTAIFSIFDAVLLRSLAYQNADRLVNVWSSDSYLQSAAVLDATNELDAFEEVAATAETALTLTGGDRPQRVEGANVTSNLFRVLGVQPIAGRSLHESDARPGAPAVAVIGEELAQQRFGKPGDAIGAVVQLEGVAVEVVGVMPSRLRYPVANTEIWRAWAPQREAQGYYWGSSFLKLVARLSPGVSRGEALAQVQARATMLRTENPVWKPDESYGSDATVEPIQLTMAGNLNSMLRLLLGAAVVVLLVACANVANLLLARSSARHQEAAIRSSLGAGRWRLVVSLMIESLLIAGCGAAVGLGLAFGLQRLLVASLPGLDERFGVVSLDVRVLAFALALTVLTALTFGLAPALRQTSGRLMAGVAGSARGAASSARQQTRVLAIAQLALAVVLLFLSGLLLQSLRQLLNADLGFQPASTIVARVDPADAEYSEPARRIQLYREVIERLEALPQVESAAAISRPPMSWGGFTAFDVPSLDLDRDSLPFALRRDMTPGTLQTLGIPLLAGRDLSWDDVPSGCSREEPCAVVVNRAFEERLFSAQGHTPQSLFEQPDEALRDPSVPVGASLGELLGESWFGWFRVVGVSADARLLSPESPAGMSLFFAHAQNPGGPLTSMSIMLRGRGTERELGRLVTEAVAAIDGQVPVDGIRSLQTTVAGSMSEKRLLLLLIAGFAVLSLTLCCIGVYGVVSYFVDERQAELGVRAALGATPQELRGSVLRQAAAMTAIGVLVGGLGCYFAVDLVQRFLFQTNAMRLELLLGVPAVLVLATLGSAWLPARRAAKMNPVEVLRAT